EAEREDQRVDRNPDIRTVPAGSVDALAVERDQAAGLALEVGGAERKRALAALLLRARGAEDVRPGRPRVAGGAGRGRRGEQLDRGDLCGLLAQRGTQSFRAGVAAAEDHDALAADVVRRGGALAADDLVLLREVVHGEHDAGELAAGHGELA